MQATETLLFFSRGRGHGHAIPDMAIADALCARRAGLQVVFASYATGAETLRSAGRKVLDLGLPESNTFIATHYEAIKAIHGQQPRLVVAHEEFAAIAAAKLFDISSVFVSAWLPAPGTVAAEALNYATSVVLLERAGIFPAAPALLERLVYTGPIVRKMRYTVEDRSTLRREEGIADDELVVVVVAGGAYTESQVPIADLVHAAFSSVQRQRKRLIWISKNDEAMLKTRFHGTGVQVLGFVSPIERTLASADLVITKGTRGITLDAAAVGVPSLSLSAGNNPVDDLLVPRIPSNTALYLAATTVGTLRQEIESIAARPRQSPSAASSAPGGLDRIVETILATLESA